MILTYKFRVKDATVGKYLDRHARAVNFVWNYCCEIQRKAESIYRSGAPKRRWPTAFDLIRLCTGTGADVGLHSDTVQAICRQFATSRDKAKRCPRFRASGGQKRSPGWIPLVSRAVKLDGDCAIYLKRKYRFWLSREIGGQCVSGCFVQNAIGHWYVCFNCEVEVGAPSGAGRIGIDLGLKNLVTLSNGETVPALQHYRRYESALAVQQRARNKRRVRVIHAKIANARKDNLHKISSRIAAENSLIVVGDVSASKLVKTRLAKSVSDAGWSMFRYMLSYKAELHGAVFIEADERWTTQTCSCCGTIPDSSPKGMGALGIRHWVCQICGASHDRDVNAAQNILRVGLERQAPIEEILAQ